MKINKSGFIVCLIFAAIFAVGGVVLFCLDANSSDFDYSVIALLLFIFAAIFIIAAIVSLINVKRQKKRYETICANLAQMDCHAQFLVGAFGEKGAAGKAAAKTAASALGGALMAIFFGFGAYKIYGANNSAEFVLTDGGLFVGRPTRGGLDFDNMAFIENGALPAKITIKKNCVIMNADNGDYFNFNTKNSGADSQQVAERLNKFLHPVKVENAQPSEGINANVNSENASGEESNKHLPPDDPFAD